MKIMDDFYLDVSNDLKDFPENETDSYFYVQGESYDEKIETHTLSCGSVYTLANSIRGAMSEDTIAAFICDAVHNYVSTNDNEITKLFLHEVGRIKKGRHGTSPKVRKRKDIGG